MRRAPLGLCARLTVWASRLVDLGFRYQSMRTVVYQCCYCGEAIESGAQRRYVLDPCAVVLIGNWQAPEPEQLSQQFFSHFDCFRRHLSDPSFVDIDQMEPGDQA
jgi:hypothetical protein